MTQAVRPPPTGHPLAPLPRCQEAQSGRGPDRPGPFQHHTEQAEPRKLELTFISTANKEKDMAAIDEIPDVTSTFHPVRTGMAVMVAGVDTGSVLYVVSVVVAGLA